MFTSDPPLSEIRCVKKTKGEEKRKTEEDSDVDFEASRRST